MVIEDLDPHIMLRLAVLSVISLGWVFLQVSTSLE